MTEEEFYRALRKGDIILAKKHLRKMEPVLPKTRILYLQGVLLERAGDHQEALKRYDMALVMHLSDPSLWLAKARVLSHLGRLDLAKRASERALKLSPGSVNAHVLYGNLLLKMRSYEASMDEARTALGIDPQSTGALILYGLLLSLKDQDFNTALTQFDRAIDVDEGCHEAWTNRGIVLKELGDRDGAIYSFRRALEIYPSDGTAMHMLASMGLKKMARVIDLENGDGTSLEGELDDFEPYPDAEADAPEGERTPLEALPLETATRIGGSTSKGLRGKGQGREETIELKCPRCGTIFTVRSGTRFSCPDCDLQGEVD